MTAKKITIEGFLDEFKNRHEQMEDRPFCWVLGSGASLQSGIPTGSVLVEKWLKELHQLEDFNNTPLEQWATADVLEIPGFEYSRAANYYPWVYHRRFRDYKEQGYAFLEKAMEKAEPSFGYSVLAGIMANTHHKVAITTNFDNLIADALSIYTKTFPLVCGHESLTGYIRANLRRPLVAKIHRDLLLAPLSNPDEIAKLPGEWATALKKIFDRFTPIVIGYGGNDGSLMDFLRQLEPLEGGIFWCYRGSNEVEGNIQDVIKRHKGRLVPILGFDELMLQLQEKLQLPILLPQLQIAHDERVANYRKQFEALTASLAKLAETSLNEEAREPVRKAAAAAVERLTKEKNWWSWILKAQAEPDPAKSEAIYLEGLEDFPKSPELCTNLGVFLERQKRDDAYSYYAKAFDLAPDNALFVSNFAWALYKYRKQDDEAERLFRKALEIDPNLATTAINFAFFIKNVRKDYDEAERLYQTALELDPNSAINASSFANFMMSVRKNYGEAERLYLKALELDPNNANATANFAQLLGATLQIAEARKHSARAWELLNNEPSQDHAEVAFTRWLLNRASGLDGVAALGRLRTLLDAGFRRVEWTFDQLLATLVPQIPKDERGMAQKLADAILDETKVSALDSEPLWKKVKPIPLTAPWPT